MRKQGLFRLLSLAVVLGLAVVAVPASSAEPKTEKLKVAALMPLSGGAAQWGIATLRALELMTDKINAQGIKVGDKKYVIELVKADTKSSADDALAQANRLVYEDKIKYIVGPIITPAVLAVQPVTEKNKVLLFPLSYSPQALGPDRPYTFRLFTVGHERVEAMFAFLKENYPKVKTVGLIGPNDDSAWSTSKVAKEKAARFGYKVTFEEYVQRGTTDFFPVLTKLTAKNPDALMPHSMPPAMTALLLQQCHQLGYKGLKFSPSHYDNNMLVEKAGAESVEGFIFQTPDPQDPKTPEGVIELVKNYEAKYKEPFNPITVAGYGMLWVIKLAIEKAGTVDTTAVAETLGGLEGEFPYGKFSFGGIKTYGINHQIQEPIFMSRISKGKLVGMGSFAGTAP